MRAGRIALEIGFLTLALLALMTPTSADILPPCCKTTKTAISFLQQLRARPQNEPLEFEATWLQNELAKKTNEQLIAIDAAIAGYCINECSEHFRAAQIVVTSLRTERTRTEDRNLHEMDWWIAIMAGAVGGLAGGAATAAANFPTWRRRVPAAETARRFHERFDLRNAEASQRRSKKKMVPLE